MNLDILNNYYTKKKHLKTDIKFTLRDILVILPGSASMDSS